MYLWEPWFLFMEIQPNSGVNREKRKTCSEQHVIVVVQPFIFQSLMLLDICKMCTYNLLLNLKHKQQIEIQLLVR